MTCVCKLLLVQHMLKFQHVDLHSSENIWDHLVNVILPPKQIKNLTIILMGIEVNPPQKYINNNKKVLKQ